MIQYRKIFQDILDYLKSAKFIFTFAGVVLMLLVWHIASIFLHEVILVSPVKAFMTLSEMINTVQFRDATYESTIRMIAGIGIGGIFGFVLGIFAGLNSNIKYLLEPARWMIMSISPVIVVVLAMLWFGMGTQMVISISAFLLAPIVYVNTMKGIEMVDENLVEMTEVYNFSVFQKLIHVYIPALIGPLAAAMTIVIAMGVRMIILAELLGANSGIGYELSLARSQLNTPELYAWILVTLLIVGFAEFCIFKPLENYFLRWKSDSPQNTGFRMWIK